MSARLDLTRLPLPPFAHEIDKHDELVVIYCGKRAWKLAEPGPDRVASLAYPRGKDPADFRWPVHSKRCLVLACGEPQREVDLVVIELLRQGATIVYAKYTEDGDVIEYDPRRRRGAA